MKTKFIIFFSFVYLISMSPIIAYADGVLSDLGAMFGGEQTIYLEKNEKFLNSGETYIYAPEQPLHVMGQDTSLCFVVGRIQDNIDYRKMRFFWNEAFSTALGEEWEQQKNLINGQVKSVNELIYNLKQDSSFSMTKNAYNICHYVDFSDGALPKQMTQVQFSLAQDLTVYSIYWKSSSRIEQMREAEANRIAAEKKRPFDPQALYQELVTLFPRQATIDGILLDAESLTLVHVGNRRKMFNLREEGNNTAGLLKKALDINHAEEVTGIHLHLSDNALHIVPKEAAQVETMSVALDKGAIHSCSARFFGAERADLILVVEKPPYMIDIRYEEQLLEWCWKNERPILSAVERSSWEHNPDTLPVKTFDKNAFPDFEIYKKELKKSCGCGAK